jgi:MoaA/NifB/PqqE/SkfB family radical SAM enzyme
MEHEVPLTAHLELTHRCRWNCAFCCNPKPNSAEDLTTDQWFGVLGDLRRLGGLYVTFTGGDPLVHPGFVDIAQRARHLGMAIRVFTNGSLIDERMADTLADLPCLDVELSVHGATAASHDAVTGVSGSFTDLWRAVDLLVARTVPIVLKCPLTIHNEGEFLEIVELAEGHGVPLRIDPCITAGDDGRIEPLRWRASRRGIEDFLKSLADRDQLPMVDRRSGQPACGVGRNTVAVDPAGNVFPCIQWRHESLGNVRRTPLAELWSASTVRQSAASAASAANEMLLREGDAVSRYPFCPAISARESGGPPVIDSAFLHQAKTADSLRRAK